MNRRKRVARVALVAGVALGLGACQSITWTPDIPSSDERPGGDFPVIGAMLPPPTNPPLSATERYRLMQELEIARDRNAAIAAGRRPGR